MAFTLKFIQGKILLQYANDTRFPFNAYFRDYEIESENAINLK